jgi:hypothetical protein
MNLTYIGQYYRDWFKSMPFDIGVATTDALKPLTKPENQMNLAAAAKQAAYDKNEVSCSNGCMMRSTAIPVWG